MATTKPVKKSVPKKPAKGAARRPAVTEALQAELNDVLATAKVARDPYEAAANLHAADTDTYVYLGDIARVGYEKLTRVLAENSSKQSKATLVLATYGGDPDAGFRIARALRHCYEHLTIVVPTYCKSAGTLICVAADELVICDAGELGPLDIQINKPDEVAEFSSGLDIMQSLNMLKDLVLQSFQDHMIAVRFKNNVSTKVATEIATKLAIGAFAPIYAQIDPNRVGEIQRANQIVWHYAQRLNEYGGILRDKNSLGKLVYTYPSHGFVIDRREAKTCFKTVRSPTNDEFLVGRLAPSSKVSDRDPAVYLVPVKKGEEDGL
ncbi:TPA: hypothetical protein ACKP7U_004315 [Stenotrophomonas maltophilia]